MQQFFYARAQREDKDIQEQSNRDMRELRRNPPLSSAGEEK